MRKSYKFARRKKEDVIRYRSNLNIKAPELQIIDGAGQMLGVMTTGEALKKAHEAGFDLVEVSPKANPPVAKFLDWGKFQYQQEKQMRKQKIRAKKVDTKGVRLSAKISDHDLEVKANQTSNFLDDGQKVKIEMILRGREHQHVDVAKEVMKKFIGMVTIPYQIEQDITKQGGRISLIIFPGSKKNENQDEKEKSEDREI
jgi:translation initiation factor IF-3